MLKLSLAGFAAIARTFELLTFSKLRNNMTALGYKPTQKFKNLRKKKKKKKKKRWSFVSWIRTDLVASSTKTILEDICSLLFSRGFLVPVPRHERLQEGVQAHQQATGTLERPLLLEALSQAEQQARVTAQWQWDLSLLLLLCNAGLPAHSLLDAFGAMAPAHSAAQPSALFSPSLDVSNAFDESTRLQNVSAVGAAAAGPASCWVTVFGFGPALTAAVIEELLSCGQIVSHHTEGSNWVKVQFETPVGAQRALARDGTVLDRAGVMIGVRRTLPPRGEGGGRDGGLSSSSNVSMSVATPSRNALLLAQQRSVYSIAPVKTPFENAPYALTSWWAKVLYYVFGI
jgi:hypothetical protein